MKRACRRCGRPLTLCGVDGARLPVVRSHRSSERGHPFVDEVLDPFVEVPIERVAAAQLTRSPFFD
ncbi:MAG: hypothetical protein BGO98_39565 [Myxococcales bacterium 68-20]|nr:MAG: hypothetical protein BGO98_39565 [Myxococcales bacterium 68-20]